MISWILGVITDGKAAWFIFRKLRRSAHGAEINIKPYSSKQDWQA